MDYQAIIIINIILTLTCIGLIFGLGLAYAELKFGIELDPRIHEVEDVLPKGQCGACGFAGCAAYAEAVVIQQDVSPNLCIPGKTEVAKLVACITGKEVKEIEGVKAHILCYGMPEKAFIYDGIPDCEAANLLFGGNKTCQYACLGMGNCLLACKFEAISMSERELPVVNTELCSGCGQCVRACPKGIIELIPETAKVKVRCKSLDKGPVVKKICSVGCIGCGICAKECPYEAIKLENSLAIIDHAKCITCIDYKCLPKCPTSAIVTVV
ncbi:MAG: RnfABCDGE type electron transport complex subunit B [Nitrospirota bacterium]